MRKYTYTYMDKWKRKYKYSNIQKHTNLILYTLKPNPLLNKKITILIALLND